MMRQLRVQGLLAALGIGLALTPGTSSACSRCHQTPCVLPPAPATQCVTEMVPYTVNRVVRRINWQPVTETVMAREAVTTFIERPREVCRPVFDTTYISRTVPVCRTESETTMVTQTVPICRPVTTTRQVTEICMQPTTQLVTVPVQTRACGLCGKTAPSCGCATVARTCYTPVPVVRDVSVTQIVTEMQTRQVPITRTRLVSELKTIEVPITNCRIVREVVMEKIPLTTFRCVPKTITRQIPVPVCETVTETCYRPVTRVVPVAPILPAPQAAPSGQLTPSTQS